MAFIGRGFDFDNDGDTDAIIGMNVGGREKVCGKTFPHEAREMFSKQFNLPNGPCIILKCGFCREASVAYTNCPWCGAANTWQHDRNFKFNSGWLECSRCEKRLGDNPCPRCGQENAICNFHLLEYKSEEELRQQRAEAATKSAGCAAALVGFLLTMVITAGLSMLKFLEFLPGEKDPRLQAFIWIYLALIVVAWVVPLGFAFTVKAAQNPSQNEKLSLACVYVRAPSGDVIGPVDQMWLLDRVMEGSATLAYGFANSPSGPWQLASSEEMLLDKLGKLKPSSKDVVAGQIHSAGDIVAAKKDIAGRWVKLPSGKTGGPFEEDLVLMNARQGKYPPGTVWSEQAHGPWVTVPGLKAAAVPPPAPIVTAVQWWIRTPDGKQSGPHTKEQLAKAAAAGRLPQGTVAANSPNGPWKPVQLRKQT